MKYSVTAFLVFIALCLLPSPAPAQQGPEIPCVDCPPLQFTQPYPFSGNWHNPESFEGGFMFEIQAGRLGGIFHHYDQDGDPTWAVIIGTLQPGEGEVLWKLETELGMVEGGTCIGCPSQQPQPAGSAGTIRLEFLHRNYGRFQIDDGEWQNIVPLLFGIGGQSKFAPHSDQLVPDLGTKTGFWITTRPHDILTLDSWVLVFRTFAGLGHHFSTLPVSTVFPQMTESGVRYTFLYTPTDFSIIIGEMNCTAGADQGPVCILELDLGGPLSSLFEDVIPSTIKDATYIIHPGNISPNRFEGESEDGSIALSAFRLDYD